MNKIKGLSFIAAVGALAFALSAGDAEAVKSGDRDGSDHPYVGLMVAQDANGHPMWRCSGTLISPTVYLTAGHCTFDDATGAPVAHVEIWFDDDVESGIPGNGYPFEGDVGGTAYTHPYYPTASFIFNDVGVVILDEPVEMDEYGALPELDQLDNLQAKRRDSNAAMFTAVGYGLQEINPVFVEAERVRMVANPELIMINVPGFTGDFSLLLTNNHSTGGTCFGDSGGPNFIGNSNVVGGVTSFGINGNCAGTGGVFRMDRANSLLWVQSFLAD